MFQATSRIESDNGIKFYEKDVLFDDYKYNDDIDILLALMKKRLKLIGIHNRTGIKHVYYAANDYKKYQIYNIIKNCLFDMRTIQYFTKTIK